MNDQFWKELRRATEMVTTSGVRRADGRGFKVYNVGETLVRIDIDRSEEEESRDRQRQGARA